MNASDKLLPQLHVVLKAVISRAIIACRPAHGMAADRRVVVSISTGSKEADGTIVTGSSRAIASWVPLCTRGSGVHLSKTNHHCAVHG